MPGIYRSEEYTSPRPLHQQQASLLTGRAAEDLPFGRVVWHDGGGFRLANPVTGLFSGVSVRVNTLAGQTADVLPAGVVESQDWTGPTDAAELSPGQSYFLADEGKLSLQPPLNGCIIRIGRAITETTLLVTFDLKVI